MGVVVRYARAAMRRRDAQRLQIGLERVRLLRSAIVGVQHQWLALAAALAPARSFNQRGCLVAALARMYLPSDQLAAEQVDDGIQIEEHAAHLAGQVGHVPASDLVGAVGHMSLRFGALRRLGAADAAALAQHAACGRKTIRTPDRFSRRPDAARFAPVASRRSAPRDRRRARAGAPARSACAPVPVRAPSVLHRL